MIRRVGIVAAWLATTMVAMLIAATAVGSVRGQVTDVPAIPTAGTSALLTTTTAATEAFALGASTAESTTTTTTVAGAATGSTTTTSGTTTTTVTSTPITTPTTVPTSTTTTTVPHGLSIATYTLIGGQVTISTLEPDVGLVAAVPAAGFSAEIEESGPGEVKVEFESSGHKSSFRARWEDSELDIKIKEESEDD